MACSLLSKVLLGSLLSLQNCFVSKKIKASIPKNIIRELVYLCTKEVHFMFNDEIYIQSDGVAMGSPLGPLLANIFMTSLEKEVYQS